MHRIAVNLASRRYRKAGRDVHLAKYSPSPFMVRLLAIVGLATLCAAFSTLKDSDALKIPSENSQTSSVALTTISNPTRLCGDVRTAPDQCSFVKQYCQDEDDGRVSYLELYYCTLESAKVGAWFVLIPWTAFLFMTVGITAGDFFAVNLSSIARILRMSDTFAGVTLLALGNGGPDIFSTWAAISSNSPELAIGELVGAASFITLVIAGTIPLVETFRVREKSLVRDALFLLITACFLLPPLITQEFYFWQGIVMIALYLAYVFFVMGYHWWVSSKVQEPKRVTITEEEDSEIMPTETRPLLNVHQRQRQHDRDHPSSYARTKPEHMSAAIYQEIGEWRRAHGRCISAKDDYIVQPSLMGSCEYPWRKRHAIKHPQAQSETNTSQQNQHSLPSARDDRTDDRIFSTLFPAFRNMKEKSVLHISTNIMTSVPFVLLKIIIPVVDNEHDDTCDHGWSRWLLLVQGVCGPQFVWIMLWLQAEKPMKFESWAVPAAWSLVGSVIFIFAICLFSSSTTQPRWHPFLSFFGFVLSAFTLSTIADEIVAMMKAFGAILGLSEAILGFTIFAIGNSIDDWVANITVSQHGHPIMALSACFGGPLLNILLGLGASTTYVLGRQAQRTGEFSPMKWNVDPVLIVTTAVLAATLLVLVPVLRFNQWQMDKKIGVGLIAAWMGLTIANLVLELI